MYWNGYDKHIIEDVPSWIVTLDVLKSVIEGNKSNAVGLNSNIRCIEIQ